MTAPSAKLSITPDKNPVAQRKRAKPWTKAELSHLKELWRTETVTECSRILGRAVSSVYEKAKKEGFERDPEHAEIAKSAYFKRGHIPANSGKIKKDHGVLSRPKRSFKRGIGNSNNAHPLGTEDRSKAGILIRKVRMAGERRERWRPVKDIVYEQHYGAIPAGHIINFADGNNDNHEPENLIPLTRAEMMDRNRIQRYGPEYAGIAIALGRFKSKLTRIDDEKRK